MVGTDTEIHLPVKVKALFEFEYVAALLYANATNVVVFVVVVMTECNHLKQNTHTQRLNNDRYQFNERYQFIENQINPISFVKIFWL